MRFKVVTPAATATDGPHKVWLEELANGAVVLRMERHDLTTPWYVLSLRSDGTLYRYPGLSASGLKTTPAGRIVLDSAN